MTMTEEMTTVKQEILSLVSDINRPGIGNVIAYLDQSDYFTMNCHHHHHYEGGLAVHSLEVYQKMRALSPDLPDESVRIVALFHDLCTTHLEGYDEIGRGHHGKRSVGLLDVLGFELHDEERTAICNHMHHVPTADLNEGTRLWHDVHLCDRQSARQSS